MSKEESKSLRLLVVSNRLPVTVTKNASTNDYDFKMSSGGLVAALSGLKKQMSFTWIGWPGKFLILSDIVQECEDATD
jgi:trehalose-6-phosphate synthase